MKIALAASLALASLLVCAQADIIAQWDFNSIAPDDNPATGTLTPSYGAATATHVGNISTRFFAGDPAEPGSPADNSAWSTASYPAQSLSNKTAGVQFQADTTGWDAIRLSWSERHSPSASRCIRLQVSTDAIQFADADRLEILKDSTFTNFSIALPAAAGAANNQHFAFRLVTEFDTVAAGTNGLPVYLPTAATNTYSSAGAIRFDNVAISGTRIPGANTAPVLSRVAPQTARVTQRSAPIALLVFDAEDAPETLVPNVLSSDPAVVPATSFLFTGSGSNRVFTFQPGPQPGTAQVTLQVTDSGGRLGLTTFLVTVLPLNTAPWITRPATTNAICGQTAGPVPFTVGDLEIPASSLLVTARSLAPALLPDAGIQLAASGSNRLITLTSAPALAGVATVELTVSDGACSATNRFPFVVTPSADVLLCEPFAYPDGPVTTNSAFLWATRSGTPGETRVAASRLLVDAACSEDVFATLPGGPWETNHGTVLYAAFQARFLSLPKSTPEFFAHFGNSTAFRGRVYAGTRDAAPGCFRLFVANGSDTNTPASASLPTNSAITIVTRYAIDTAATTLWVNPQAPTDPGVSAIDVQNPARVSSYCFRQTAELGALVQISELRVGRTFASVLPAGAPVTPIPLRASLQNGCLVLSWDDPAFTLEISDTPAAGFVRLPSALSPYTNDLTALQRFFRLVYP